MYCLTTSVYKVLFFIKKAEKEKTTPNMYDLAHMFSAVYA